MMGGPRSAMVNGPPQGNPQMNCGPGGGVRMTRASVMMNSQGMSGNMVPPHMTQQHIGNIPQQAAMSSGQTMMQHPQGGGPPIMTRMVIILLESQLFFYNGLFFRSASSAHTPRRT